MSHPRYPDNGPSASSTDLPDAPSRRRLPHHHRRLPVDSDSDSDADEAEAQEPDSDIVKVRSREQSPPPQYPASEAPSSPRPPPFSSLFTPPPQSSSATAAAYTPDQRLSRVVSAQFPLPPPAPAVGTEGEASSAAPAYTPPWDPDQAAARTVAETKNALPTDSKAEKSSKDDDAEPPPAYTEGDSPLFSFSYVMAAAGGASSIITQVQQGGPPINAIGDVGADETITMDLR